jgi:hypothetical protein
MASATVRIARTLPGRRRAGEAAIAPAYEK